jgi:hypothetical protein
MVAYSHNALAGGRGTMMAELHDKPADMRNLLLVPLASAFGSSGTPVTLATLGGTLLLQPRFDPGAGSSSKPAPPTCSASWPCCACSWTTPISAVPTPPACGPLSRRVRPERTDRAPRAGIVGLSRDQPLRLSGPRSACRR